MPKNMVTLGDITAAILVGGLGTRLRSLVADRPKVLAEVAGRPFLTYLLDQLVTVGTRNVVLCSHYMADKIEQTVGSYYKTVHLIHSKEKEPLGTGGALRYAWDHFTSDSVLVMNGDSFINADFIAYSRWFFERKRDAALLLGRVSDTERFGRVSLIEDGLITGFEEKGANYGPGWINAGVYIFKKELLRMIPPMKPYSLEKEFFPNLVGRGLYGYESEGEFIDIGTPESYTQAELFFRRYSPFSKKRMSLFG